MPLIQSENISELEREVIVEQILGLAKKDYNLRQLCRVIPMKELHAKIRFATSLTGTEKVGEGVEAPLKNQSYSTLTFDLWKNVVHFAITKEAEFNANENIWQMHATDAARELAKMENDQIATEMHTAVAIAGNDWGNDDNDPTDDIMAAMVAIENTDKGFTADTLVVHPLVHADLVSNDNIYNKLERGTLVKEGEMSSILGLKILKDRALNSTEAIVMDTKAPALVLGEGPDESEEYSGQATFTNGIAIAKWLEPKIVQDGAIRRLTNVHT